MEQVLVGEIAPPVHPDDQFIEVRFDAGHPYLVLFLLQLNFVLQGPVVELKINGPDRNVHELVLLLAIGYVDLLVHPECFE